MTVQHTCIAVMLLLLGEKSGYLIAPSFGHRSTKYPLRLSAAVPDVRLDWSHSVSHVDQCGVLPEQAAIFRTAAVVTLSIYNIVTAQRQYHVEIVKVCFTTANKGLLPQGRYLWCLASKPDGAMHISSSIAALIHTITIRITVRVWLEGQVRCKSQTNFSICQVLFWKAAG